MIRLGLPRRVMVGAGLAPALAFPSFRLSSPPSPLREGVFTRKDGKPLIHNLEHLSTYLSTFSNISVQAKKTRSQSRHTHKVRAKPIASCLNCCYNLHRNVRQIPISLIPRGFATDKVMESSTFWTYWNKEVSLWQRIVTSAVHPCLQNSISVIWNSSL